MTGVDEIARNLAAVRARLAAAGAGARATPVTLVAVGKTQPEERIEAALEAGQRVFGENYVQEAKARWAARRGAWPGLELHLVGPLQTNKAADAVALFDVVQSLDRERLASALAAAEARLGVKRRYFVQVNTGEEPQKAGVAPAEAVAFVERSRAVHGLDVVGLMAIPPADEPASPHFALLARLAREADVAGLSMGMSADYEEAVRFGATHVRIGTAVFGERPRKAAR
jgi:pyridoxal phosphate enzyme (YggS family)